MGIDRNRFMRKKEEAWVEWLSDVPPRSNPGRAEGQLEKQVSKQEHQRTKESGQKSRTAAAVSIQINLPKFRLPKSKMPWGQVRYYGILTVICLILAIGVRASLGLIVKDGSDKPAVQGATTEDKPSYKPLTPKDKQDIATNPSRNSYDPKRKLYTYQDRFLSAELTISQQPLPDSFKKNPAEMIKAADSIQAKDSIETAFGKVYIGYDEKTNIERAVFAYKDLLVFIQSNKKLDKESWKLYVESMRQT